LIWCRLALSPLPRIISPREQAEIDAAAAAAAAPPPPPPEALDVAVSFGQAAEYTRIEFVWPEVVSYELEQDGNIATVTFSAPAIMDLVEIRAAEPRLLQDIAGERGDTDYQLVLTLDEGASARIWDEGERIVIDLLGDGVSNPTDVLAALTALADAQNSGGESTCRKVMQRLSQRTWPQPRWTTMKLSPANRSRCRRSTKIS
jgi:hypothetical protein